MCQSPDVRLTPEQGRVLGCLVEKQLTTPLLYPLTDNALLSACNQTTSRDPVVAYDLATVRLAVRSLREQGLLRTVHRYGERTDKHQHELPSALELSSEHTAVLAVLLLRGPQTAAEVRARTERMHAFGTVQEVDAVLDALVGRGLVTPLERQPGRREDRYAETLVDTAGVPPAASAADAPSAGSPAQPVRPVHPPAVAGDTAAPAAAAPVTSDELAALRSEVRQLRSEVDALREQLSR